VISQLTSASATDVRNNRRTILALIQSASVIVTVLCVELTNGHELNVDVKFTTRGRSVVLAVSITVTVSVRVGVTASQLV
jgi:hypothetical protein